MKSRPLALLLARLNLCESGNFLSLFSNYLFFVHVSMTRARERFLHIVPMATTSQAIPSIHFEKKESEKKKIFRSACSLFRFACLSLRVICIGWEEKKGTGKNWIRMWMIDRHEVTSTCMENWLNNAFHLFAINFSSLISLKWTFDQWLESPPSRINYIYMHFEYC